jgi:dipeptidyl aminopeptidase/acylaminoacyl peptidase
VLDDDGSRLLSTRESPTEQPNYYLRSLKQQGAAQLTASRISPSDCRS